MSDTKISAEECLRAFNETLTPALRVPYTMAYRIAMDAALEVAQRHPQPAELAEPSGNSAEMGEQQGDLRARFELWCEQRGYNRSPAQNNCGITVFERYAHPKVQIAWEAWQAALAATGKQQVGEPCTHEWRTAGGGSQARRPLVCSKCNQHRDHMPQQVGEVQGDAGFDNQMGSPAFEVWAKANDYSLHRDPGSLNYTGDTLHAWWAWDHLTARQPGAQVPVAEVSRETFNSDGTSDIIKPALAIGTKLYAAPPAQADHPYQRITGLQGIGDAADYLARHPGDDYAQRRLSERVTEFCQKHGVSPAQGIDLGPLRRLYQAYVRLLESGRDRIIDFGGTCDPVDVMERTDVDLIEPRNLLQQRDAAPGPCSCHPETCCCDAQRRRFP